MLASRAGNILAAGAHVLWTLASHVTYDQLVTQRGWPPEQYRTWLADTLSHTLLPD